MFFQKLKQAHSSSIFSFLEINEKPGQLFRSPLMFTKLVSEAAGEPIRLVVLRRRSMSDVDDDDDDDDDYYFNEGNYLQRTINAVEQVSKINFLS